MGESSGLNLRPISRKEAFAWITAVHRHHKPPTGFKFAIAAHSPKGLIGVVVVGRPVSYRLDNGTCAEVSRLCTDGTMNACTFLYGAACRAAEAMGYCRIVTYTLPEEGGGSLRAAGWVCEGEAGGGEWATKSRSREPASQPSRKLRWSRALNPRTAKALGETFEIERMLS